MSEYESQLQFREKSSDEVAETYAKQIAEKDGVLRQFKDENTTLKEQITQAELKVSLNTMTFVLCERYRTDKYGQETKLYRSLQHYILNEMN